jgi:HAD superfamily hydrolase (TIGR01490 family)
MAIAQIPEAPTERPSRVASSAGAAFFDLDRTLISRPTPLALAALFRRRGLLRTRDLVRAGLWRLLFLLPGIDGTGRAAVDGMRLLRGLPVATLNEIMGEAMEDVLRPLLYTEPVALLKQHRENGDRVYIVSASLQEIVQHIADDLGFDAGIGSTCEIVDGVFTGRSLRPCYGDYKAAAVRELATRERIDLSVSTAYSDSHTDLAFLEAVGQPVAINPDSKLSKIADSRRWPVLHFTNLQDGDDSPTVEAGTAAAIEPAPPWVTRVFVLLGVCLLPWTVVLALTLPARHGTTHYGLAWTGFDVALAVALLGTGIGAARRAAWLQGVGAAAATLLICDAWFDILSATSRNELFTALVLAVFVELPVAAACLFVARHAEEAATRTRRYAALAHRVRFARRRSIPPVRGRGIERKVS